MMIKYRVWDKLKQDMSEVECISFVDNKVYTTFNHRKKLYIPMEEAVLMQSTGLFDKNGKEIFEGDIVKRTYIFDGAYGETHIGEVVYDKEYARYVISRLQKFIEPKTEALRNVLSSKSTYEVIGNIYETTGLLDRG